MASTAARSLRPTRLAVSNDPLLCSHPVGRQVLTLVPQLSTYGIAAEARQRGNASNGGYERASLVRRGRRAAPFRRFHTLIPQVFDGLPHVLSTLKNWRQGAEAADHSEGAKVQAVPNFEGQSKHCISCKRQKLLVDFQTSVAGPDGRYHVCRACVAASKAAKFIGRPQPHVLLSVTEAWENAKPCTGCGVRKELRDFGADHGKPRAQCRACESAAYAQRPIMEARSDCSQRCALCGEIKKASEYPRDARRAGGISHRCTECHSKRRKEAYQRRKERGVLSIPREAKLCTHCGKTKPASEYTVDRSTIDGLKRNCKPCCAILKKRASDKTGKA